MIFNYQEISSALLENLSPRARDIIGRRFGLLGQKRETLEAIGNDHGITRERIRQIQEAGLSKLRKGTEALQPTFQFFSHTLEGTGNLRKEEFLLQILGPGYQNHVFFFLSLGEEFERFSGNKDFYPLWLKDKGSFGVAQELTHSFEDHLKKTGKPQSIEPNTLPVASKLSLPALFAYLEISKRICRGPNGLWGLFEWPEINPRGARDRAYLILKKAGQPLHFSQIAEEINKTSFSQGYKKKKVLVQTVHNELIRDSRFVLVGRGLYALKEWGYEQGTVGDVIFRVLKSEGSLSEQDLVDRVLEKRMVKKSTILQNLRNKDKFKQGPDNTYSLIS